MCVCYLLCMSLCIGRVICCVHVLGVLFVVCMYVLYFVCTRVSDKLTSSLARKNCRFG